MLKYSIYTYAVINISKQYEKRIVVNNQKIDNELNLALSSTDEERVKTENLNVGYDNVSKTWQLIVRYSGTLNSIRKLGVDAQELLNGYAILNVPQELVDIVAASNEILYVEKPKRLSFAIENSKRESCINPVQRPPYNLHGAGCIVAIIDSGIDYANKVFLDENGESRILELWDQTINNGTPPEGYTVGSIYNREDINVALQLSGENRYSRVPSRDASGHGTSVASIAVGNFAKEISSDTTRDVGVATRADIIAVKLGNPLPDSFPKTSELMLAIDFCVRKAVYYGRPMAINISFGNNYGSHDGRSLLATYIDSVAAMGKIVIAVGSGNEGASESHAGGILDSEANGSSKDIEFVVGAFETSFNIQIWKDYVDSFQVEIISPSGESTGNIVSKLGAYKYRVEDTELLIYYGEPSPYNRYQEIFIEFVPLQMYVNDGLWKIRLTPISVVNGRYDMWLPSERTSINTRFLRPNASTTLTVPSTASQVITVGAYDAYNFSYADFSGRGYTRATYQIKPDIVAPGVNISCSVPGGDLVQRTGTSFATPFVAGSAALMMEWGVVRGNDAYLYGEKIKAYMIKGARQLPGYEKYPNSQVGWGALCVEESLPL